MRFFKADCQDEARVIQNFGGLQGLTFVGVFDGHGPHGRSAAKFASDRLPEALEAQTAALQSRSEKKRLKAMREACRVVNTAMQDHRTAGFDASLSGTTACFALVVASPRGTRVLLANVGDSRCVLARRIPSSASSEALAGSSGGNSNVSNVAAVDLTVDAKPDLPNESRRIIQCGGVVKQLQDEQGHKRGPHRVFRRGDDVLPGLAMSRSLGDTYAHGVGVTWEPTLSAYTLTPRDSFLVLGTDGVWDVMDGTATVDFVERYRCNRVPGVSCAEALTLEAQERWKAAHDEAIVDDISVAILHFAPMPPLPEQEQRSLPRTLSRAASNNDEANALASAWKESEANPSIRSPRPIFQYLYRTSRGTGSGDFWDSLPRDAPGSPFKLIAAEAEAAQLAAASVEPPVPIPTITPTTSATTTTTTAVPIAVGGNSVEEENEETSASLPPDLSSEESSSIATTTTTSAVVASKSTESRGIPVPTAARAISNDKTRGGVAINISHTSESTSSLPSHSSGVLTGHPVEHAVHGGHSLRTNHSFSLATMHESSPVIDIPHLSAAATAGSIGLATATSTSSYSSRPIPMAGRSSLGMAFSAPAAPGVLSSSQEAWLRPIRKAYPSQATMVSVPSWDGAFHNSFLSDSSLPLGVHGTETPRSSESEEPSTRPRRHEGRHEGKVRRGIPCSYSSTGMASFGGRLSTDSEGPSLTTSQIGSLDELGNLAASLAGTGSPSARQARSVAASGHGISSGMLGKTLSIPLSPSRRGLPRPSSHGSLLAAFSDGGGMAGGAYRTASGRVNILRPIGDMSVPPSSPATLS
jgi:serine/threonine protein phosphatase PrpC